MTSIVTLQKVDLCVVALLVHIEELHTAVTTTHLSVSKYDLLSHRNLTLTT